MQLIQVEHQVMEQYDQQLLVYLQEGLPKCNFKVYIRISLQFV